MGLGNVEHLLHCPSCGSRGGSLPELGQSLQQCGARSDVLTRSADIQHLDIDINIGLQSTVFNNVSTNNLIKQIPAGATSFIF